MMVRLHEFILTHTDEVEDAQACADLVFFKVALQGTPTASQLHQLLREKTQESPEVDVLDGQEHSFIELGGWLGSQGLALRLMGLGSLLSLWQLLTPRTVLGAHVPDELAKEMAGQGMVTVVARKAGLAS